MFEKASRLKLRFDTSKGQLTTEDLWDLPLTSTTARVNLDDIARALHKQLKSGDDVSFVDTTKKSDAVVQLKFDLVKYVIETKLTENAAKNAAAENSAKKQRIMQILADRQDDSLKTASTDDLMKMLAETK